MSQPILGACKQSKCSVATTGKCFEGVSPVEECPHFIPNESSERVEQEEIDEPVDDPGLVRTKDAPLPEVVAIPFGADLTSETARRIMGSTQTNVIVLAGDVNSGKTTLLTSIYERFLDGTFGGYMFARSETLPGFERRCHLSRITSDRISPDTDRTRGPMTLLHLRVQHVDSKTPPRELLFSDISGEDFEAARNSVDVCRQMPIIKRADHCLLLIDGKRLVSLEQRQKAFRGGEMLLRSLLDSGMLGKQSLVDVLFTKYDLIRADTDNQTLDFLAYIEQELRKKFSGRLARIRFYRVAARPIRMGDMETAYGLEEAFPSWVEETAQHNHQRGVLFTDSNTGREFDRYLTRRLPAFISKEFS